MIRDGDEAYADWFCRPVAELREVLSTVGSGEDALMPAEVECLIAHEIFVAVFELDRIDRRAREALGFADAADF